MARSADVIRPRTHGDDAKTCDKNARSRYSEENIDFTVVCSVTWPLNGREAGGDLVLIQTSLLFVCKERCSNAN